MSNENEKYSQYNENNDKINAAIRLFEQGLNLMAEIKASYIEIANAPEICPPYFVDKKEAARLLSVSDRTITRMARDGKLAPYKFEGATRYRRQDLEHLQPSA